MRKRYMDCLDPERGCPCGGASGEVHHRALAGRSNHFDLCPGDAACNARAERLGSCLLGCEPGRKAFRRTMHFASTVRNFCRGVHTVQEAISVTGNRFGNSLNLCQI